MAEHYQRPGWFTTNVFNRLVAGLTRMEVGPNSSDPELLRIAPDHPVFRLSGPAG